jgi:hypothetical protein
MPYILYRSNGTKLATIEDGTLNKSSTDLTFVGKNYAGYGEVLNQNLVKLLENFANSTQPATPMVGQLWYDSANKKLTVYDGTRFRLIQNFDVGSTQPRGTSKGDLWFNEYDQRLYVYNGTRFVMVGPQSSEFTGIQIEASLANSDSNVEKYVLKAKIEDDLKKEVVAVFARDQFIPNVADNLTFENFTSIKQGITLQGANSTTGDSTDAGYYFWGTAASAIGFVDFRDNTKTYHRAEDYLLKVQFDNAINFGLNIPNDEGLVAGSPLGMIKIHADNAAEEGKITVLNGNKLNISLRIDGTVTNVVSIINRQIIPNIATGGVSLGITGSRFSYGYINTLTVTSSVTANTIVGQTSMTAPTISAASLISSPAILATNITATTVTATINGNINGNTTGIHYGNLESSSISATGGLVTNVGTIKGDWSLVAGSRLRATYSADIAERYHADKQYDYGTVLVIGGENEVTTTVKYADVKVAGIVSKDPAYMMNDAAGSDETHPYIALKGRVPCKVVGRVRKGDLLTTSNYEGYAAAVMDIYTINSAAIIGKALGENSEGFGLVEVMV